MLKDIYSPLEIDEVWDQRAPMAEGDAAAGATALIEPAAPMPNTAMADTTHADSMPMPGPGEPDMQSHDMAAPAIMPDASTTEVSTDAPHVELHSDSNQMITPDAPVESDVDAVAKLSGDDKTEEATTDPSDSAMDNMSPQPGQSVMPTETIKPKLERNQPEEKAEMSTVTSDVDAAARADDTMDTSATDTDSTAETPAADDGAEHFVLGGADHPDDTETATPEPTDDAEPVEAAPMAEASGDDIDTKIEAAMAKIDEAIQMLKTDKEAAASAVAMHEQDETEARTAKETAQSEKDKIDAELSKLEGLKPAA